MVTMDFDNIASAADNKWVTDGLDVVKLQFVRNIDELESLSEYEPEYVHQHFGESEKIFGYKDLKVTIFYAEMTLHCFPVINYSSDISSIDNNVKKDDILGKLRAQLPEEQMSAMVDSKEEFRAILSKQDSFLPFGELISKFTKVEETFEMFLVENSSRDFDAFLARVQTLSLWYIDACGYTDNSDPKWMHYFVYASRPRQDGAKGSLYRLAGYCSFYRFYAYPEHQRPRLAQILVLPQFRRSGFGASFLKRIYDDLRIRRSVIDITVEDPADNCIFLRDYVDCTNCSSLPSFSKEKLMLGFSPEMCKAAKDAFKINKRQCRRVYEILRLRSTERKDEKAMKEYRIDVKRRLEIPLRRNERDWKKLNAALNPNELSTIAANQNDDAKRLQLSQLFEAETEAYFKVIERMQIFPTIL